VDTTKEFTAIEWCAGYGGIHLGLKRAIPNLRVIAYGEIEAFCCANLVAKMEAGLLDPAPLWTDIKTFPCEDFRDRVDLLVAGYPCQPFSAAGKRLGTEDPRHLWPHIARSIRVIRPRLCFFENVEGHISLGLREVIGELESIGYKAAWGIFSAAEVGAPHQRKRVFILAVSNSLGGAAGLSRSLAWNEGVAGVSDNGGGKGCGELADSSRGRFKQCESKGHKAGWISFTSQWPSRPGEPQHGWEPPRVVGDAEGSRPQALTSNRIRNAESDAQSTSAYADRRQIEPSLGRNAPRRLHGVDLAELSGLSHQELAEICEWMVRCDNRTDELRLLGNGVVPATAERAFRVLIEELI
jgi:DNA-cytosine methyltransferase